jgi:zinc transport system ATP-binding protein
VSISGDTPVSVLDFMMISRGNFPAWIHSPRKKTDDARAALEMVSAEKLIDRRIGELSGGELQRVLLASALNPLPEILLLDEPVSGVDAKGLFQFYETICELRRRFDISIILVTHDLAAIAPHADRMILIDKKLIAEGKPSELLVHPECIKMMGPNFLDTTLIIREEQTHGGQG